MRLQSSSLLLSLLSAATATATTAAANTTTPGRATWLWETTTILPSASQVSSFLSFAAEQGINRVYAQSDPDLPQATWSSFLSQCASNGLAVEALVGDPAWITGSSAGLDASLDWIAGMTIPAGFAGVAMDIEPWALDDWEDTSKQGGYVARWQELALQVKKFADGEGLTTSAALPFWADEIAPANNDAGVGGDDATTTTTGGMDVWMLENVLDAAVFMTYRNTAEGLWSISTAGLEAGQKTGKQAWLAVETRDVGGSGLSYVGMSLEDMMADVEAVSDMAAASAYAGSFGGFAIEDYTGAVALD